MRYKIIATLLVGAICIVLALHNTKEIFWEVKPLLLCIVTLVYLNILKDGE